MNPLDLFETPENTVTYAVGEKIFQEGDAGDYLYVLLEGEVDILSQGKLVRSLQKGAIFGEMALIDDSPRSADAVAKAACTLAPVDERRFLFLVHETPLFALHVMTVMAERLRS